MARKLTAPILEARSEGRATRDATLHCGRARVGSLQKRLSSGYWIWELHLISDASRGHPRGVAASAEEATRHASERFEQWLEAAGLQRRRK